MGPGQRLIVLDNPGLQSPRLYSVMSEPAGPTGRATRATQVIHTERLRLDPLAVADADEMADALGDAQLHRYIGGRPASRDELRDRYARMIVGRSPDGSQVWHNWTMRGLADGRAVGSVQATVTDDGASAELAWVIATTWQGQGLGSEAAKAMLEWLTEGGVTTMSAHIHAGHIASEGVARRIGLALTSESIDGERVWCRALAEEAGR